MMNWLFLNSPKKASVLLAGKCIQFRDHIFMKMALEMLLQLWCETSIQGPSSNLVFYSVHRFPEKSHRFPSCAPSFSISTARNRTRDKLIMHIFSGSVNTLGSRTATSRNKVSRVRQISWYIFQSSKIL